MSPLLSRPWQAYIEKVRSKLVARKLLDALEIPQSMTTIEFVETVLQGQNCSSLFLGPRQQANGENANIWAYVLPNDSSLVPPVVFRDKVSLKSGERREYPRSATSLLRKATELCAPFCFLHFRPEDDASGMRNKICAVVLYYALTTGVNDYAMHWNDFELNLFEALKYITSRAKYRQWRQNPLGDDLDAEFNVSNMLDRLGMSQPEDARKSEQDPSTLLRNDVDIICSQGSQVKARMGTKLAEFKAILGSKVQLLDRVPQTPISFSRQEIYPTYYPLRLHFGTFRPRELTPINVYIYLTGGKKTTTRIEGHNPDGSSNVWSFHNLQGISLVGPFFQLAARTKLDPRTQGNKIRQLVLYYFMLAENEGFAGVPPIRIHESLLPSFYAACKTFPEPGEEIPNSSNTGTDTPEDWSDTTTLDMTPGSMKLSEKFRIQPLSRPSAIIKLKLNPKLLESIAKRNSLTIANGGARTKPSSMVDSGNKEDRMLLDGDIPLTDAVSNEHTPMPSIATHLSLRQPSEHASVVSATVEHRIVASTEVQLSHPNVHADVDEMDWESTAGSRSMFISTGRSPEFKARTPGDGPAAAPDTPLRSPTWSPISISSSTPTSRTIKKKVDEKTSITFGTETVFPVSRKRVLESILSSSHPYAEPLTPPLPVRSRAISVISISSSNSDVHRAEVIDLCGSDSEDQSKVKEQPDLRALPGPHKKPWKLEHNMVPKGTKRKSDALSKDNDGDMISEVNGDHWKRASWTRSQEK